MENREPQSTPAQDAERSTLNRLLSAGISAAVGALTGYMIGRLGDHTTDRSRALAQWSFAGIGGVFGSLLSIYATRRQAEREAREIAERRLMQASVSAPEVPAPKTAAPAVEVSQVAHDGQVEAASVAMAR